MPCFVFSYLQRLSSCLESTFRSLQQRASYNFEDREGVLRKEAYPVFGVAAVAILQDRLHIKSGLV